MNEDQAIDKALDPRMLKILPIEHLGEMVNKRVNDEWASLPTSYNHVGVRVKTVEIHHEGLG